MTEPPGPRDQRITALSDRQLRVLCFFGLAGSTVAGLVLGYIVGTAITSSTGNASLAWFPYLLSPATALGFGLEFIITLVPRARIGWAERVRRFCHSLGRFVESAVAVFMTFVLFYLVVGRLPLANPLLPLGLSLVGTVAVVVGWRWATAAYPSRIRPMWAVVVAIFAAAVLYALFQRAF